jgi:hypothetical protein
LIEATAMTKAVVIGQSHSAAIAEALGTLRASVSGIRVYRLEDKKRPHLEDTVTPDEAVSIVANLPGDARVFLSTLGTHHNILALLRSGPTFDFLLDENDTLDPVAEMRIPHRAVKSAFERHLNTSSLVQKIRSVAKLKVFLLSTPPPKQSNEFMLEQFLRQKTKAYRGRSVEEVGIERAESRRKLWLMETRAIDRWAKKEGLKFLAAPSEAFDENGFLAPQYYSDATHANAHYGALVVDQICAIVERTRRRVANG